jgi:hypothetical protein
MTYYQIKSSRINTVGGWRKGIEALNLLRLGKAYNGRIRAATLDNLFSPRAGTEIPYVSPTAQYAIFPYVPLQILYFPYKYCILYICREIHWAV